MFPSLELLILIALELLILIVLTRIVNGVVDFIINCSKSNFFNARIVNGVVDSIINCFKSNFFNRKTSWKEWEWSLDDDEENHELLGPLESIPFKDIRKLQPHPDFPNDRHPENVATYLWKDENANDRRYYVKIGLMDDYIGNGSPHGDICYCLYERKNGQNYIRRFFSRGKNKEMLKKIGWLEAFQGGY